MAELAVRAATLEDVMAIAAVNVRAWKAAYGGLVPDPVLDRLSAKERAGARRDWMSKGRPAEQRTWVITGGAKVIGYSDTGPARDEDAEPGWAEVWTVYLDPAHWDRGAGRQLFAHATADLSGRGYGPLVLWTMDGNARARRFYEAAGWRWDGARKADDRGDHVIHEVRYRLG
ncbi:MAG: N-acetyltransferase family protein [Dehalococcoidia bacterium]